MTDKFKIGLSVYEVIITGTLEVPTHQAEVDYATKEILIIPETRKDKKKYFYALKHELAHALVWEYLHDRDLAGNEVLIGIISELIKKEDIELWRIK